MNRRFSFIVARYKSVHFQTICKSNISVSEAIVSYVSSRKLFWKLCNVDILILKISYKLLLKTLYLWHRSTLYLWHLSFPLTSQIIATIDTIWGNDSTLIHTFIAATNIHGMAHVNLVFYNYAFVNILYFLSIFTKYFIIIIIRSFTNHFTHYTILYFICIISDVLYYIISIIFFHIYICLLGISW